MEPEVLAQHQMVEIIKLRDYYIRWEQNIVLPTTNELIDIAMAQTGVMLRTVIKDLTEIIEQT